MMKWMLVVTVLIAALWGLQRGEALRVQGQSLRAADLEADAGGRYLRASYSPLHFWPKSETASDDDCLACHGEVLTDRVRPASPAGLRAQDVIAWYQQMPSYEGGQESFHRRHLISPQARSLMQLRCNFCHRGHDPREEAPGSSADSTVDHEAPFTLRKQVDVASTCLRCHGQFDYAVMNLPGPWHEVAASFPDGCLTCHATIRTERHRVDYLDAEAIEAAGQKDSAICYGCHGGRAWYRLSYPYPRTPWPGMPEEIPDWAKNRPTATSARLAIPTQR